MCIISNHILIVGYTRKIQKLRSGVFLYDLTKKIETAIKNSEVKNPDYYDQAPKKLNVYSTVSVFDKIEFNLNKN